MIFWQKLQVSVSTHITRHDLLLAPPGNLPWEMQWSLYWRACRGALASGRLQKIWWLCDQYNLISTFSPFKPLYSPTLRTEIEGIPGILIGSNWSRWMRYSHLIQPLEDALLDLPDQLVLLSQKTGLPPNLGWLALMTDFERLMHLWVSTSHSVES